MTNYFRHFCHPRSMDTEQLQTLLSLRDFVLLAFPSKDGRGYSLTIKLRSKVTAREAPFVVDSPEEGARAVEAKGLVAGRCSLREDICHLSRGPERVWAKRRLAEAARERGGLWR